MGMDKALVEFRGQPLVVHSLRILREAGMSASIAGARSDLKKYAPVINDFDTPGGPLGGICAVMKVTPVTTFVFVPVDLPLLPASLLWLLQNHAQVTGNAITTTSVAGFVETFPVVLDRAALPKLRAEFDAGRRGCIAAFGAAAAALGQQVSVVAAELLVQVGQVRHPEGLPPSRWFFNVNSELDLRRARAFR
jgi:molybdopterin-guanine dinucleotide biosynthesis protein A